jgi:hypothetical protein
MVMRKETGMKTNFWKTCLVVLFCMSILLISCTPQRNVDQAPAPSPDDPSTELAMEKPPVTSAQDIALAAADLGEGWVMDAEVSDLNASYYFDMLEDGKALIGTHRTVDTPAFDPATVESITMRAYSNRELKLALFHSVVVFHENAQAEGAGRRFQPDDVTEGGLPREWTTDFGERYSAQAVSIGDEGALVSGWLDEDHPLMNSLEFRKGRVWVGIASMGRWDDLDNYPPLDEEQLKEVGRQVEARIP